MECDHQPRHIQGVLLQTADGHWIATFLSPDGASCRRVTHCPFCGTELWGRPPAPEEKPLEAVAHTSRPAWRDAP